MKITKYEHACLDIEEQGLRLIIDPGSFVSQLVSPSTISGIVVTHMHADHFNEKLIREMHAENPKIVIFGPAEVTGQISELLTITVGEGESHEAGPFNLKFFGGMHAEIHPTYPRAQNFGVLVNDNLYYAGDSYAQPPSPVNALAVPAHAPWMKAQESMNYMTEVKAKVVFPTHNGFLSSEGVELMDRLLGSIAKQTGIEYKSLKPGDSIEI